jgi:hypothetical protein
MRCLCLGRSDFSWVQTRCRHRSLSDSSGFERRVRSARRDIFEQNEANGYEYECCQRDQSQYNARRRFTTRTVRPPRWFRVWQLRGFWRSKRLKRFWWVRRPGPRRWKRLLSFLGKLAAVQVAEVLCVGVPGTALLAALHARGSRCYNSAQIKTHCLNCSGEVSVKLVCFRTSSRVSLLLTGLLSINL